MILKSEVKALCTKKIYSKILYACLTRRILCMRLGHVIYEKEMYWSIKVLRDGFLNNNNKKKLFQINNIT